MMAIDRTAHISLTLTLLAERLTAKHLARVNDTRYIIQPNTACADEGARDTISSHSHIYLRELEDECCFALARAPKMPRAGALMIPYGLGW